MKVDKDEIRNALDTLLNSSGREKALIIEEVECNATTWLRALLDENERIVKENESWADGCDELDKQLEVAKKQRDKVMTDWKSSMDTSESLIDTIESLRSELEEKNKALEWYAADETYKVRGSQGFRDDIYVFKDKGERARYVLSQYEKTAQEASHG